MYLLLVFIPLSLFVLFFALFSPYCSHWQSMSFSFHIKCVYMACQMSWQQRKYSEEKENIAQQKCWIVMLLVSQWVI